MNFSVFKFLMVCGNCSCSICKLLGSKLVTCVEMDYNNIVNVVVLDKSRYILLIRELKLNVLTTWIYSSTI